MRKEGLGAESGCLVVFDGAQDPRSRNCPYPLNDPFDGPLLITLLRIFFMLSPWGNHGEMGGIGTAGSCT